MDSFLKPPFPFQEFRRIIQEEMFYLTAAPARRYIISDKEDRSNITEETSNGDMNHVDDQLTRSRQHRARPPRDRGELALYIALPKGCRTRNCQARGLRARFNEVRKLIARKYMPAVECPELHHCTAQCLSEPLPRKLKHVKTMKNLRLLSQTTSEPTYRRRHPGRSLWTCF